MMISNSVNNYGNVPSVIYFRGIKSCESKKELKDHNSNVLSFNSQPDKKSKSVYKKIAPYVIAGIMLGGGINSCNESRVTGVQDLGDSIKVEYVNVKPELKDSVLVPLVSLKSKLNNDNNFLKGVDINFVKSYDDLPDNHSFKTFLKEENFDGTKGISFYSDGKMKRVIVLEEDSHGSSDKMFNYVMTGRYSNIPTLKHSLMHEVGHQFDEYFGHDHNAKFAHDFDSLMYAKEMNPSTNPYSYDLENEKEEDIFIDYTWNASLSDRPEFQEAIKKDFEYLANLSRTNSEKMPLNMQYYGKDIDLSKPITMEDIDLAEQARTETYANLFSYAVGENDGDKEDFINGFKNAYKVVRADIAKYVGPSALK